MRARSTRRRGAVPVTQGAAALVLLSCLLPSAALAAFPGDNGRIAYAGRSPMATYSDIFTVFPNGSGVQQLTDSGGVSERDPSWSADGRRLAYTRYTPGSRSDQVFTMNASGENQRQVTHDDRKARSPSFSPSGRRIVYQGRASIFTIRRDGTHKRRIARDYATDPEYSPDGKRIVFAGSPNGREDGIWTVRPDGSHLRRLTYPGGRGNYDQTPTWSPNGKHIVFLRCDTGPTHGCEGDVYVMRPDGSDEHPLRRLDADYFPAFSPNGRRIALTDFQNETCTDVYTITLWGTKRREVTHNCPNPWEEAFAVDPSWQPVPGG